MRTVHAEKQCKKLATAKLKVETESNYEIDDWSAPSADPATGITTSDESFCEPLSSASEVSSTSPSGTDDAEKPKVCNFDPGLDLPSFGDLDPDSLIQRDLDVDSFSMLTPASTLHLQSEEIHADSGSNLVPPSQAAMKQRVFDAVRNEYVVPPSPSVRLALVPEQRDSDKIRSLPEPGQDFDTAMVNVCDFEDFANYSMNFGNGETFDDAFFIPETNYHS